MKKQIVYRATRDVMPSLLLDIYIPDIDYAAGRGMYTSLTKDYDKSSPKSFKKWTIVAKYEIEYNTFIHYDNKKGVIEGSDEFKELIKKRNSFLEKRNDLNVAYGFKTMTKENPDFYSLTEEEQKRIENIVYKNNKDIRENKEYQEDVKLLQDLIESVNDKIKRYTDENCEVYIEGLILVIKKEIPLELISFDIFMKNEDLSILKDIPGELFDNKIENIPAEYIFEVEKILKEV